MEGEKMFDVVFGSCLLLARDGWPAVMRIGRIFGQRAQKIPAAGEPAAGYLKFDDKLSNGRSRAMVVST